MSTEADTTQNTPSETTEVYEVQGNKLIATLKGILTAGKVNRLVISSAKGKKLIDIPYAAGLTVTALLTLIMPLVIGLGPLVLLVGQFRVEVVRPEA